MASYKLKIVYIFLFFFMAFFFVSCKEKKDRNVPIITPITIPLLNADRVTLEDTSIMDIKQIIELDSRDEALLGDGSKIFHINDKFYIFDRIYSVIKVFDEFGNFLYSIGKIGDGPGEYTRLFDVDFNNTDSTLLLYSNDSRKLIKYDLQGRFVEQENIPFFAYFFVSMPKINSYLFYINYNSSEINNRHNLLITDKKIDVKKKYFHYDNDEIPAISFSGKICKNNEGVLFANALEDTIFQIVNQEVIYPKYIFDFQGYGCPKDLKGNINKLSKGIKEKSYLENTFLESNDIFYFSFVHKKRTSKGFWLKKLSKMYTSKNFQENSFLHIISSPKGINEKGDFIALLKPDILSAYIEEDKSFLTNIKQQFPELYPFVSNFSDVNNPILITFKVKI